MSHQKFPVILSRGTELPNVRSIRLVFLALNIRLAMFAELQRPVLLEDESDTTEKFVDDITAKAGNCGHSFGNVHSWIQYSGHNSLIVSDYPKCYLPSSLELRYEKR